MVGTENVTIGPSNLFTRLDGNAVFIGGYNRGAVVTTNEFIFIGDNVIAQWGDTSAVLNENKSLSVPGGWKIGPDGRGGDQPRGTKIIGNVAHEIGLWQKQSSLYFQAVSTETIVQGNVFFNGPRAALNFNGECTCSTHTPVAHTYTCVYIICLLPSPLPLHHALRTSSTRMLQTALAGVTSSRTTCSPTRAESRLIMGRGTAGIAFRTSRRCATEKTSRRSSRKTARFTTT